MIKLLLAVLSGGVINLASSEFYAYAGHWSLPIVRWAASKMPASLRARFEEEWTGVLHEKSGNLSKLSFSLGCCIAALRTPSNLTVSSSKERYVSTRAIYDQYRDDYREGRLTGRTKLHAGLWVAMLDSASVDEIARMTTREACHFVLHDLKAPISVFDDVATIIRSDGTAHSDEEEIGQVAGWIAGNIQIAAQMYKHNIYLSASGKWIAMSKQKSDVDSDKQP